MSRVAERSTRDLENLAREIEDDINRGNLTRREEDLANKDLDIIIEELRYRSKDDRPKERSYGGGYNNDRNSNNKDVGSYFNKTTETSMSAGSIFGGGNKGGMNKGFTPEAKYSEAEREEPRRANKDDGKEHKVFFSPKYPFVTSPNVKEILDEVIQKDEKTIWHIKKREFTGNDDATEFTFKYEPKWDINPLFNNINNVAYISDMSNPKIPKTVLPANFDDETILDLNNNNKTINKFIFNEISLDMTNCIQAIDYFIRLKDLEDIKAFLNKPDFKTEYLKHIGKIYKSFKIDVKDDCLELNLNKKHIYANIPDLVIPNEGEKFFVNEASNETLYQLIKSVSTEYKNFTGLIEGFDYKFFYYVGFNKILLVRA